MACDRDTVLLISCYADGEATHEEASRAKTHLEDCRECRRLVENWSKERTMLEWTYATELPREAEIDWRQELARRGESQSPSRRYGWTRMLAPCRPLRLVWTGALAAAVIVGFLIHHFTAQPPMLEVGARIVTSSESESARMDGGIELRIGPNSKVTRIDDRSIRLKKGWVNASVRHGSGLRVLTRRIRVLDVGTVFRVGTGPKLDYVIVREGSVSVAAENASRRVEAGQMLVAQDKRSSVTAGSSGGLQFYYMRKLQSKRNPIADWRVQPTGKSYLFTGPRNQAIDSVRQPREVLAQVVGAPKVKPILTGADVLPNAKANVNTRNHIVIDIQFDDKGKKTFAHFTRDHVGGYLAVFYDGRMLTCPLIREPILGGNAEISGFTNLRAAKHAAEALNAGRLPVTLKVIRKH